MNFPDSIKVGAVVYKVRILPEDERFHEYNEEYGHIDFTSREISLSTKYSDEQKRDSLVHEIVHAISKHMNLGAEWGDEDENYVKRLSNGLNMVFRDNPDILELFKTKDHN